MKIRENPTRDDERVRIILREIRGKNVVHIGCTDAPYTEQRIHSKSLLHEALLENAKTVLGVDVDEEGLNLLRSEFPGSQYIHPTESSLIDFSNFEIVLAGEVIEHILDFPSFLDFLDVASAQSAKVIITTPNAYALKGTIRALFNREMQHPDHTCLFSPKTLDRMLSTRNFVRVKTAYYTNPPRSFLAWLISLPIQILLLISPRARDGLIFTYKKQDT